MGEKKIALIGDALYKWDGGVDFLTNIAAVLNVLSQEERLQLFLFLPRDSVLTRIIKKLILGKKATDELRKQRLIQNFDEADIDYQIVFYPKMPRQPFVKDAGRKLDKFLMQNKISIALPVMIESYPEIKTPWISYIPDLQEKHFPELFSEKELRSRDAMYRRILNDTQYVLVTSDSVRNDIKRFYPNVRCKIFATPFAPVAPEQYIASDNVNMEKYRLPSRYFVISNQFWAHKSHDTAFRALEILYEEGERDVHIFCTGELDDYRTDEYIRMLKEMLGQLKCKNNIHILGFIPKMEQIELIKGSRALIQPSLFEGDCGGCSVYLARSLCVHSILSDIPVNQEGNGDSYLHYFRARDEMDLAKKMREALDISEECSEKIIETNNVNNCKKLGRFYLDMLHEVMENYSGK